MTSSRPFPRKIMFRHYLWGCSFAFLILVLSLGTWGFIQLHRPFWDAFYGAIQLFGLNFDLPEGFTPDQIPVELHFARLLAPFVLIAAVIKLMADGLGLHLQRLWNTRTITFPRDLVLGFGPLGQEVGRRLIAGGRSVTWVDRIDGNEDDQRQAREQAERLGGFLIVGDPSDLKYLRHARIDRVKRVFVALKEDIACLDAAEAARQLLPLSKPVRVFTSNPVLPDALAAAAETGFLSGRGLDLFSIKTETARHLVMTARWDRLSLLLQQERVHLVIAGGGDQGQALLQETLLLNQRAGLRPPLVTVLDIKAHAVRDALRRRAPALFDDTIGVRDFLAPRFRTVDLHDADFAALDLRESQMQSSVPVTAWVICTGDDDLNLRVALHLHTGIQTRRLDGAPVYLRVQSGHGSATHAIETENAFLGRTFGNIMDALEQTSALSDDPDAVSKILHDAYLSAEAEMLGKTNHGLARKDGLSDWNTLSSSKRNSNRRAYRHAPMKLADLGFSWRNAGVDQLPVVQAADCEAYKLALSELHRREFLNTHHTSSEKAVTLFKTMQSEHDRWCIDRALDGWRTGDTRDESRLFHPNMVTWDALGQNEASTDASKTRAYDAVLVSALIENHTEGSHLATKALPTNVMWIDVEDPLQLRSSHDFNQWKEATELRIRLPKGNTFRPEKSPARYELDFFLSEVDKACKGDRLCLMTLMFPAPPSTGVAILAHDLKAMAQSNTKVEFAFLWRRGVDHSARLEAMFKNLNMLKYRL